MLELAVATASHLHAPAMALPCLRSSFAGDDPVLTTDTGRSLEDISDNSSSSGDGGVGSGGGGTASSRARTLKCPRLVWSPQLHKCFVDAVSHLGIRNAVPKTIMQLMNVEGLTRENVASHLQKYRLYLRRLKQGSLFLNCGNSPAMSVLQRPGLHHGYKQTLVGSPMSPVLTACNSDHLFGSSGMPQTVMASVRSLHLVPEPSNHPVDQHTVAQHQLNRDMAMVESSPLFNLAPQPDIWHHTANTASPSLVETAAWPSPNSISMGINAAYRMENRGMPAIPSSPPPQALALFPL